ncbi:Hypothetical predicted protein [Paramuricea clavata]|uniref:PiggyBac transposable element-derived protein domain-containing protein n=1 Tax=Paramuricea clavata TaxID=317549 RepID=A0A7D9LVQ5_PARCT|nr:Hypothetical predicted protein [Paramuricea clavata]
MAEALSMLDSSEDKNDFEGFLIDETVEETRPIAAGTSAVSWRDIAGDSDDDEEDFHGFSDIEVQELNSDSVSKSGSEISNNSFDGIFEWKDNLSSVSVEDFTADFGPQHGLGNTGFKTTMPSKRFQILNKYFHISDPRQENPTDKLTKIRPLISKLENAFQDVYVPGKNISIDEGLIKFNGRLSFKQYMPKKPNKFGIKIWMLADSETYFVPRFQVYLGKQQNADENDAEEARGLRF